MTSRLPIMTLACLLAASGPLAAQDELPSGNDLVTAAASSLMRQPSFEAKIRQRASVFGQLVAGAGTYLQSTQDGQLRARLEFKVQVGDRSLSLLHVNDGSILWIRRDVDQETSQAYVNLRRIREAAVGDAASQPPRLEAKQIALGGLAQLIEQLALRFDFDKPVATQVGETPVWQVQGKWKASELQRLLGKPDEASQTFDLSQLPEQLPATVKLTLGRDQQFPLFPYRVEFARQAKRSATPPGEEPYLTVPLVTLEFFEVRRRTDLSPDLFKFPIGDQTVEDQTEQWLPR